MSFKSSFSHVKKDVLNKTFD